MGDDAARTSVGFELVDGIATVTLNRPHKLNALTIDLCRELAAVLRTASVDERVRAIVITGAGRAFCAGADIDHLKALLAANDTATVRELLEIGRTVVEILYSMSKPSIVAVNGPAAGAGAGLALACDFRIASESATIGQTFNQLALHPDWGVTYSLPRVVGTAKAFELVASGDMIDADEAQRLGIFGQVVPGEQLREAVTRLATALARKSPVPLGLARNAIYGSSAATLGEMLDLEIENQMRCLASADVKEGIEAFFQKRRPVFRGT